MNAEQTDVLVRMTSSVTGVGRTGDRLTVTAERGSELVAMGVAAFEDEQLQTAWRKSSAYVHPDVAAAAEQARTEALEAEFDAQQAAGREETDDGKTRPRVRESRPRGGAGARDASGGTAGAANNAGGAEPGQGDQPG